MSSLSPSGITRPHAPALPGGPRASWRAPSLLALAVAATAACTGDEPAETLRVSARGSTLLVARQGGEWEPVPLDVAGNGELDVAGPYELVRVCAETAWTRAVLAGPGAFTEPLDLSCADPPGVVQVSVSITSVGGATNIYIGSQGRRLQGEVTQTTFVLDHLGRYDIVAVTDDHRVLFKRGIEITGATTVGLDVVGTGVALDPHFAVSPPGGRPYTRMVTANGTDVGLTNGSGGLWVPPPASLVPDDVVYAGVYLQGETTTYQHSLVAVDPSSTTPYDLPLSAPIDRIEFATDARASARWSVPSDWPWALVTTAAPRLGGPAVASWQVQAHRPSRPDDDTGSLAMPDVTTIPGWKREWTVTGFDANWSVILRRPGAGLAFDEVAGWLRL